MSVHPASSQSSDLSRNVTPLLSSKLAMAPRRRDVLAVAADGARKKSKAGEKPAAKERMVLPTTHALDTFFGDAAKKKKGVEVPYDESVSAKSERNDAASEAVDEGECGLDAFLGEASGAEASATLIQEDGDTIMDKGERDPKGTNEVKAATRVALKAAEEGSASLGLGVPLDTETWPLYENPLRTRRPRRAWPTRVRRAPTRP